MSQTRTDKSYRANREYYPLERIVQQMFEVITEDEFLAATKDMRHRGLTKRWLTTDLPNALSEQKVALPVTINATGTGTPFEGKTNLQSVYANLTRNIEESNTQDRYEVVKVKDKGVYLKIKA